MTAHKKYKLTAHEGARIRKIGFVTFLSKADKDYSENCLTCLTNQGDLVIHSLPELRRQVLQVSFSKNGQKTFQNWHFLAFFVGFLAMYNQGDLVIHSLPELRRQVLQVSFSKKRLKWRALKVSKSRKQF